MEIFLDEEYFTKYIAIKTIYKAYDHSMELEEMSQLLSISVETLSALMDELMLEFKNRKCEDKIQLIASQNAETRSYTVILAESFSLEFLQLEFLKQSFYFNVIQELLLQSTVSVLDISNEYGYSLEETYIKLSHVQDLMQHSSISLVIDEYVKLEGEEISIRLFYAHFLQRAYYGIEWPFETIDVKTFHRFSNSLPRGLTSTNDLKETIFLTYAIAVTIIRGSQNHHIDHEALHAPLYTEDSFEFEMAIRKSALFLQDYLPQMAYKEIVDEVKFIYTLVLTHRVHSKTQKIPSFFYTEPIVKENDFMKDVLYIMNLLEDHFSENVQVNDYYYVMFRICLIHFNVYFYDDALQSLPLNWVFEDHQHVVTNGYYKKLMSILENEIDFNETSLPHKHKKYLLNFYCQVIIHYFKHTRYKPELNILLIANPLEYDMIQQFILSNQYLNPFNIIWQNQGSEELDIVISDVPIMPSALGLRENAQIFYFDREFYAEQLGTILNQLYLIATDKMK